MIVLASFVSPFRADRDQVRSLHDAAGMPFSEVHVHVPLEVAEARDPKGLYAKARAGEIKNFTGIDSPYEAPEKPEVVVNTAENRQVDCPIFNTLTQISFSVLVFVIVVFFIFVVIAIDVDIVIFIVFLFCGWYF